MKQFFIDYGDCCLCLAAIFIGIHTVVFGILRIRAQRKLLNSINKRAHLIAASFQEKIKKEQNLSALSYKLMLLDMFKMEIEALEDSICRKLLLRMLNNYDFFVQSGFAISFFRKTKLAALLKSGQH